MSVSNLSELENFKIVRLTNGKYAAQNKRYKDHFLDLSVKDSDKKVYEWTKKTGDEYFLRCMVDTKTEVEQAVAIALSVVLKKLRKDNKYEHIKVADEVSSIVYDKIKKIKDDDKVLMIIEDGTIEDRLMTYQEWNKLHKKKVNLKEPNAELSDAENPMKIRTSGYRFKRLLNLFFAGNFYPHLEEFEN